MTRIAVIAKINDSWVDLHSFDEMENAYSEKCHAFASKGVGHCGCKVGGRLFRADLPRDLDIRVGDKVEISASTAYAFGIFLAVTGILALAGFFSWKLIGTVSSAIIEPTRVLVAALGLALDIGIAMLVIRKKKRLPRITRILE